jgi:ATP-dependent DNA helicase RecG
MGVRSLSSQTLTTIHFRSMPNSQPHDLATTAVGNLEWSTPIQFVPGVGAERKELFYRLGIRTAGPALFFFPRDYEQPAVETRVPDLREGQAASLVGKITEVEISGRASGKSILGILVENETGAVRLLFFNQPFRVETLRRDSRVIISGVPRLAGFRMEFIHPKVTVLEENEPLPESRILPVYPLVEGLKQAHVRKAMSRIVETLADKVEEAFDERLRSMAGARLEGKLPELATPLLPIGEALREIHQPSSQAGVDAARLRLIFQELLVLQLALAMRRRRLTTSLSAPSLEPTTLIDSRICNRFSFELTNDQKQAIKEVGRDMAKQYPMNRLVQGDVGSGKTVIAQYAILLAVAHRHQAVMMVPTETLARQHYRTLAKSLAHSRVRIGLLCGSLSASERKAVLSQTAAGEIDVLVGTQALLYGDIQFHKLGLCVIDEQHKFGVEQRQLLRRGGVDPHCLVLSATPIPRTVTMTMFGDLDVSTLREKPPGRGQIQTYLSEDGWRDRWWKFVGQKLDEGRQAFVVTPRIDAAEETSESAEETSSAVATFEELRSGPLANYRVDLLHGRMATEQKNEVMQKFAQGRTQVLVSTTVIEVGIDVPNATVMTILGAERFGLAQLHQIRGRVARGSYPGYVCLFTDAQGSPEEIERLQILAKTTDGFEIAEADFRLRGPGDLLGKRQSGMPAMRIADLVRDEPILLVARELAQELIDADPELDEERMRRLRTQMMKRYAAVLSLGDVA